MYTVSIKIYVPGIRSRSCYIQTSKPTWGDRKATLSASRKRQRSSFSVEWRRSAVANSRGLYITLVFFSFYLLFTIYVI